MFEDWAHWFQQPLQQADPRIADMIGRQRQQNEETVNLVASESYCPRSALQAEASVLVNKNASGYPPRVSFGGGDIMDAIERLAIERACRLFGGEHANVQALSSTIANVAVLRALLPRDGRILAFSQAAGGHGSHGGTGHLSGQDYQARSFGIDETAGEVDYAAAERLAHEFRPHMIIAGSSAWPKIIDFARLAEIARDVGAMLFADIAHVSGLVVAGLHPNPTPLCDVVTTSTHKTLCGPRTGGLVLCRREHARVIDAALAPGLQAAPGAHIIAARAVLFERVAQPPFRALMQAVVENAAVLADALAQRDVPLYGGGTDTHMVVVDLRDRGWDEAAVNEWLLQHGIVANTTGLPALEGKRGRLGLRLGSTPMTIRGAGAADMQEIGALLADLLVRGPEGGEDPQVSERMRAIAAARPIPFQ